MIGVFPWSLIQVPKKCCDQLACEPPSEEIERPILAIVSEIPLQAVLFLSIGFGVKEGL